MAAEGAGFPRAHPAPPEVTRSGPCAAAAAAAEGAGRGSPCAGLGGLGGAPLPTVPAGSGGAPSGEYSCGSGVEGLSAVPALSGGREAAGRAVRRRRRERGGQAGPGPGAVRRGWWAGPWQGRPRAGRSVGAGCAGELRAHCAAAV